MTTEQPAQSEREPRVLSSSSHVRGSTLLLVGRLLAAGLAFITQVLIVRHLAVDSFGLFAYGLAVVSLVETISTLGLDRSVSRFVPIFDERREFDKALGTIVGVTVSVILLSVVAVGTVLLLGTVLSGSSPSGDLAAPVVLILVFLAPVQVLDNLLTASFAVFARAGAIFFRRFVLTPLLRLAVVLLLVASQRDAEFLAAGYVVAGVVGVVLYGFLFVNAVRASEMGRNASFKTMSFPMREVLLFSIPLFTTDMVFVLTSSVDAIMVGHFGDAADVAQLRAVQPVVKLNQLILASFGIMFTPLAARLFARGDRDGVRRVYWQTATWVAVLSFPMFVLSVALAEPLTVTLFGDRYADAAPIMMLLAIGYFVNSAFGYNGLTLNVFGLVRSVVVINLGALLLNLVLNFTLIPGHGPRGAAIATMATLIVQNALRQLMLSRRTGVPAFDRSAAPVYVVMAVVAIGLVVIQRVLELGIWTGGVACALGSLVVLRVARHQLDFAATFPEIARLPLIGGLLAGRPS